MVNSRIGVNMAQGTWLLQELTSQFSLGIPGAHRQASEPEIRLVFSPG